MNGHKNKIILISYILIFTMQFFLQMHLSAQELVTNEVDEFTHHSVKRTSWEIISSTMNSTYRIRVSKIDSAFFLDFKYFSSNNIFSISQDEDFMFKLSNDSIVTMKCLKTVMPCTGCGAVGLNGSGVIGVEADYIIKNEDVVLLKKFGVSKFRVYTSKGYLEEQLNRKAETIKNLLSLL